MDDEFENNGNDKINDSDDMSSAEEKSSAEIDAGSVEETTTEPEHDEEGNHSSISADLIRGHINTIILRALYERDKYGYEIMNDIEAKSHGQYALKQPTLYSALKRLETQGYIKAYWKKDDVTAGGRRKYFTLTDIGKEMTEKNLAEWEYSRTIIDSLISDRAFDFSQPAPTPVDFTILRDSVSRVPHLKPDGEEVSEGQTASNSAQQINASTQNANPTQPQQVIVQQPIYVQQPVFVQQPATTEVKDAAQHAEQSALYAAQLGIQPPSDTTQNKAAQQDVQPTPPAAVYGTAPQSVNADVQAALIAQQQQQEKLKANEEARRRAHENYLKLISEPVPDRESEQKRAQAADQAAPNMIYGNRPAPERDYKNLIDGIFNKALANGSVQTNFNTYTEQTPPRQARPQPSPIVDRGASDGIKVMPSTDYHSSYAAPTKTVYNKGLTLLKCSAIVLFITIIEFVLCGIFKDDLTVSWLYPSVILILGIIQFGVFGMLSLKGYGTNCARPTTNAYLLRSIIITVICILIICVLSFLLNANFTVASDVMKYMVIPSITALNITIFALSFYLFVK